MQSKKAFLDTEFTDFIDCQLISIGIVTEDGREFYAERTDYDESACSDFVRAAVLPQLGKETGAIVGTAAEIREALLTWLSQVGPLDIYVDYRTDWDLLLDLCEDLPANVAGQFVEFDGREIERYWAENGRRAHHALHDAKANCFSFLSADCRKRGYP